MRVLVVQTAFLGDTVFTSALVGSLRARFPQAELELCVAPRGRDVALAIPGVSRVHVFDKRGGDRGARGLLRISRGLRERRFSLAVVPHRSPRSALLAWLARIPERVGFGSLLFTRRVRRPRGAGFLEQEAALSRALGAAPAPMRLVAQPQAVASARALLGEARVAALCIGSEWATKIWPAARFAALADLLAARGFVPVLLGGPRERALSQAVKSAMRASAVDTVGNSVADALGILSIARLCVGGDTGLVHASRALGTPTVALFGPTPSAAHSFGPRERLVTLGLACSPCSAHGTRECPLGHHRCLRDLDEARVVRECEAVA